MSLPVPHCPYLSVKENDYEQRRSQVRVLPSTPFETPKLRGLLLRFITVVGLRRTKFRRPLQIPPVSPITMKHATESRGMRYATREPRVTLSGSEQPRYYQDTRTNQRNSHDAPQRQNRDRVGDSRADHDPGSFHAPATTTARFCILMQGMDNPDQAPIRPVTGVLIWP